ncbi:MAG: YncE family protein, partial [Marinicella sp.]
MYLLTKKTHLSNPHFKLINIRITLLCLLINTWALAADIPYVNWENHPVHGIDMSPDGSRLAVAHTADNRVQLFDVSLGYPVRMGHVKVGVDPVSVRFKDNNELWVVNHISDSVSVVDFNKKIVKATLQTEDEPFDVVFANNKAYVSCSQVNKVLVYDQSDLTADPEVIALMAEDPRAMTVNADGSKVYVASFESGNKTTILAGGIDENEDTLTFPFNPVNRTSSPYQGENPPPNDGDAFLPALNPDLPTPPKVSLIVKQMEDGRWMDDNNQDWTEFISGSQAAISGRLVGWELLDHDISVIDTSSHAVSYVSGLMNIGMAIGFNQAKNEVTMVGTDATNEIRFEPVLNGKFLQVKMGVISANDLNNPTVIDLNPHLNYANSTESQTIRDQSIGDPRAVIWNQQGDLGYVSGMGSNNVIVINVQGERVDLIEVGEGATGLALDETNQRLYVWNHFAASLSTVDLSSHIE